MGSEGRVGRKGSAVAVEKGKGYVGQVGRARGWRRLDGEGRGRWRGRISGGRVGVMR